MSVSMKAQILSVAEFLRDRAEETGYGFAHPEDPHDFSPDPECSTLEERERHRTACEAWERGEPLLCGAPPITEHEDEATARAYLDASLRLGAASGSISGPREPGQPWLVHCHVGGWGIGTYTMRDPEMTAAATLLERLAADLPGDVE